MGCQGWHMACASCYLGALENLLNSILDTEQLYVSVPRYLVGDPHNKFIFYTGEDYTQWHDCKYNFKLQKEKN